MKEKDSIRLCFDFDLCDIDLNEDTSLAKDLNTKKPVFKGLDELSAEVLMINDLVHASSIYRDNDKKELSQAAVFVKNISDGKIKVSEEVATIEDINDLLKLVIQISKIYGEGMSMDKLNWIKGSWRPARFK